MQENEFPSEKAFHAKPMQSRPMLELCFGLYPYKHLSYIHINSASLTQLQGEKETCWKLHGKRRDQVAEIKEQWPRHALSTQGSLVHFLHMQNHRTQSWDP